VILNIFLISLTTWYFLIFRSHCLIIRKCVRSLDGGVCALCRRSPHKLPAAIVKDLPKRSIANGSLFWDIQKHPEHEGCSLCSDCLVYILSQVTTRLSWRFWQHLKSISQQTRLLRLPMDVVLWKGAASPLKAEQMLSVIKNTV